LLYKNALQNLFGELELWNEGKMEIDFIQYCNIPTLQCSMLHKKRGRKFLLLGGKGNFPGSEESLRGSRQVSPGSEEFLPGSGKVSPGGEEFLRGRGYFSRGRGKEPRGGGCLKMAVFAQIITIAVFKRLCNFFNNP